MAVKALQQEQPQTDNATQDRYGCLLGGPALIDLTHLIGEYHTGHSTIPRRELIQFASIRVGASLTSVYAENSLSSLYNSDKNMLEWSKNKDRIKTKSARECLSDVMATFGREGFAELKSLQGKPLIEAEEIYESVLPTEIASQSLVKVIAHLESSDFVLGTPHFQLRQELLAGSYRARDHYSLTTTALRNEVSNAQVTGMGRKSLDDVSTIIFKDLELDLPSETQQKQNLELGKTIAASVTQPTSTSTDRLIEQLIKQNELKEQELAILRAQVFAKPPAPTVKATKK